MEFYDVIQQRRSIRKFKTDAIPQEKLGRILEAGRLAPSWANKQCWRFILVEDTSMRERLNEVMNGNPGATVYEDAPITLVICADPSNSGKKDNKEYYMLDIGIVTEHIMLAICAEGLGACWVGRFDERPIKNLLNIPEEYRAVAVIPIGFPDEQPDPKPRKELNTLLYQDQWKVQE